MRRCAHWQHQHCPSVCRSYELPDAIILVCATRSPADLGPRYGASAGPRRVQNAGPAQSASCQLTSKPVARLAQLAQLLARSPLAARSRLSYGISNQDSACLRTTVPSLLAPGGILSLIDSELGARILYDHRDCVRWGMMPHTAGKTVAMYFGAACG